MLLIQGWLKRIYKRWADPYVLQVVEFIEYIFDYSRFIAFNTSWILKHYWFCMKSGGLSEEQYASFLKRSKEHTHPLSKSLGRVGQPEEIGELVAFLISDKAKFMTGECIAVDGGRQNLGARWMKVH